MGSTVVVPFAPETKQNEAVRERYRNAYQVAETTTGFSETIRNGGLFLAGVIWFAALIVYQARSAERSGFPVVCASLAGCAIFAILISRIISRGFRVWAQLLATTIDSAVTSSPYLSKAQKNVMFSRSQSVSVMWECARVRDLALLRQDGEAASGAAASDRTEVIRIRRA
ncbi:MAG TPA: hypothetical protein VEG30_00620 [Terriglobales bacterium]|nr:hypothetical protein [Terriglobales bacterium]